MVVASFLQTHTWMHEWSPVCLGVDGIFRVTSPAVMTFDRPPAGARRKARVGVDIGTGQELPVL